MYIHEYPQTRWGLTRGLTGMGMGSPSDTRGLPMHLPTNIGQCPSFVHFEFLIHHYSNWLHILYLGKRICAGYILCIYLMKIQAFVEMQK